MSNGRENTAVILASASPRRKYLLEQAGLSIEVIPSAVDEDAVAEPDPAARVQQLAAAKAKAAADRHPERWVIGADTVVVIDGKILGKPASEDDARRMLRRLGGRTHQVYTGYAVVCAARGKRFCEAVCTDVRFKDLNEHEIAWYVSTGEPFDKAGAYAIQGIGTFLVKSINGSYTNVVGLPVCEVIERLIAEGVVGWTPEGLN
jgi:septum formation protein